MMIAKYPGDNIKCIILTAADYLKPNPDLKSKLEQRRITDTAFAKDGSAQLNFVYQNSQWFEPVYLRYPVYRVTGK